MPFRPTGYLPLVLVVVMLNLSVIALAAPAGGPALTTSPPSPNDQRPSLTLPASAKVCPASGPGASCDATPSNFNPAPGQPSLPDGLVQCPADPAKPVLSSPAACDDTTLSSPASSAPAPAQLSAGTPVIPSVPLSSLAPGSSASASLALTADHALIGAGESVVFTATARSSVTGTGSAIEIFDSTTGTMVGACMRSSRCQVAYKTTVGTYSFTAFVTPPRTTAPVARDAIVSNAVQVRWLDAPAVVGPGKSVKLTAATSTDVAKSGLVFLFWDVTTGLPLTYCSHGTACSTMLTYGVGGAHQIVAYLADSPSSTPAAGTHASSNIAYLTWLSVALAANTTFPQAGGTVNLTATANADLGTTPWSLGIVDTSGRLVDKPCKTGRTCSARITLGSGQTPYFSAVIGSLPLAASAWTIAGQLLHTVTDRAPLVDVQARSSAVQPTRLLWGVDSCKPMTTDAAGRGGLLPQVAQILGGADFWGRYLTTTPNCPGISSTEIAAAAHFRVGILPIYNEYDCSAVSYWQNGQDYAAGATAAAARLGIPRGTVIVIDIEPPGDWCSGAVDSGFIEGWYYGVLNAGYAPGFYGDGTASSTFGQAWCGAVADRPEIAGKSYLWSFEPSLIASYPKESAPAWSPNQVGCAGNMAAWQYELSAGATPDVDRDEALSKLPLWYPS